MQLTIALPSGKSLEEKTARMLTAANITVKRAHPRACEAVVSGFPGVARALYTKPSLIPMLVSEGTVTLGITGEDCVREFDVSEVQENPVPTDIEICARLPFSRATSGPTRCVLFTRTENPVGRMEDIPPGSHIASEYGRSTGSEVVWKYGIRNVTIHHVPGDAESLVVAGKYPYGVTLVETGDTLRVNGLKVIGTVFESVTVLIARKSSLEESETRERVTFLARLLEGTLAATGKTYLLMNAPAGQADAIERRLPSLKSPTVQSLADPAFVSIGAVVPDADVNELMFELTKLGAEGFVLLPPSVIM